MFFTHVFYLTKKLKTYTIQMYCMSCHCFAFLNVLLPDICNHL